MSGRYMASAVVVLAATLLHAQPEAAQLFQWTPEQLIKYTNKNPYDRFPDGRPKVPDQMLERLKGLIAEEVQAVLPAKGFPHQFEPREGWKVLQPNQKMVGRVFTIQFMPARGDIIEVDEADAKARGTSVARKQTAIDMLQPERRAAPAIRSAAGGMSSVNAGRNRDSRHALPQPGSGTRPIGRAFVARNPTAAPCLSKQRDDRKR